LSRFSPNASMRPVLDESLSLALDQIVAVVP
jgi:hypothetical protein